MGDADSAGFTLQGRRGAAEPTLIDDAVVQLRWWGRDAPSPEHGSPSTTELAGLRRPEPRARGRTSAPMQLASLAPGQAAGGRVERRPPPWEPAAKAAPRPRSARFDGFGLYGSPAASVGGHCLDHGVHGARPTQPASRWPPPTTFSRLRGAGLAGGEIDPGAVAKPWPRRSARAWAVDAQAPAGSRTMPWSSLTIAELLLPAPSTCSTARRCSKRVARSRSAIAPFKPKVTLVDDALRSADPRALSFEGTPKQRVGLVKEEGVITTRSQKRDTAARAGRDSTGHVAAARRPWRGRGRDGGGHARRPKSTDRLAELARDGLYITRLHYLGVVNSREGVITGMTKRTRRVPDPRRQGGGERVNLRFTVAMPELLAACRGRRRNAARQRRQLVRRAVGIHHAGHHHRLLNITGPAKEPAAGADAARARRRPPRRCASCSVAAAAVGARAGPPHARLPIHPVRPDETATSSSSIHHLAQVDRAGEAASLHSKPASCAPGRTAGRSAGSRPRPPAAEPRHQPADLHLRLHAGRRTRPPFRVSVAVHGLRQGPGRRRSATSWSSGSAIRPLPARAIPTTASPGWSWRIAAATAHKG